MLDLGLEDRMTSKVGLLSGGQRQALTLLMATLKKPKLLLLDEPAAGMNPNETEELMEMAIADRVDGIIVQVSDEEEVSAQIDKAEEQNIPVITIRSDAPVSKRVSSVLYRLCKHGTSCSRYLRCRI